MKIKKLIILALLCTASVLTAVSPQVIMMTWDPYTDADAFKFYQSTDLSNWTLYATIPGTATQIGFPLNPGRQFFYMTASNIWGESINSNILRFGPQLTNSPSNVKASR